MASFSNQSFCFLGFYSYLFNTIHTKKEMPQRRLSTVAIATLISKPWMRSQYHGICNQCLIVSKRTAYRVTVLGPSRVISVLCNMIYEVGIFAQYTNSLLMLLHYCFPLIRGRANFSHLCQLYMWIDIVYMLSNLFHRAFNVMCSDHFKCMCCWMYIGSSMQWWLNLKEWPDDLEISSKWVKTEVAAFCLLIASVLLLLPNSTSIHVITCVLCFFHCCTFHGM